MNSSSCTLHTAELKKERASLFYSEALILFPRHTSSSRCVGCAYSPQSLTYVSSWGLAHLPPSCYSNYLEGIRGSVSSIPALIGSPAFRARAAPPPAGTSAPPPRPP
ncbi:MAG TPA: hypothetical protein DC012_05635 [Escherichia sp.]|nr:hypothetical protein [Escherichia sp.]